MPESPNKLLNNDHGNYVYATYTGHIFDTTLDIYFAEARFYDAQTRQWLAMDPIKDGGNWYQYCYSNPLRYWDPLGLTGFETYGCDESEEAKARREREENYQKILAYIEEHRPEIGITVNMLKNIGWKGGNVTIHDAAEFNSALWYYGIQSKDSIQMFLATVMVESGYGNSVVEGKLNMTDDEWIRYKNNLEKNLSYPITYTKDERGARYIQITGEENQNNYLQYILGSSGADSISASDRVDFISTNYPILCEWISLRSKCRKRFKCVSSRRLIPI